MFTFKKKENNTVFYYDGKLLGYAPSCKDAEDHFIELEDGVYRWERKACQPTDKMEMSFVAEYPMEYQMMPGLMYNQNENKDIIAHGQFEKIERHKAVDEPQYPVGCVDPVTGKVRKIAWWRTAAPGAVYTEGNGLSVGMFLPKDQKDASVSILPENEKTTHTYYWPLEEGPRVSVKRSGRPDVRPPAFKDEDVSEKFSRPAMGGSYSESIEPRKLFAVILVLNPAEKPRQAWHKLMSVSWKLNYKYLTPWFSNKELWDLGIEYIKSMFRDGENGFKGFSMGKVFLDGKWENRPYYAFEMGWTGQGIGQATDMLAHAILTGDKEAEEMGFAALDSWLKCRLPNGMLPTHIMGQQFPHNGRRVVDACNLSFGAINYFRAWEYAQALGKSRPEYFEMACWLCDFTVKQMDKDGKLAKSWYEDDLTIAIDNGLPGAFLVLALCEGVKYTHRTDYLEAAIRGYHYFYSQFIRDGYAMGGAQDHFSVDKESGIPMLQGAMRLYELTGDEGYIECAKNAAYYLSTWQWQHTHPLEKDSLLGEFGYDTYGGTVVSIGSGMDPYILPWIHELYDLTELTGEAEWAERAQAGWAQATIGVSDGTLHTGRSTLPRGSQNEAFTFGRAYEDTPFEWMPTWMQVYRIDNLCRTMLPGGDRPGRVL